MRKDVSSYWTFVLILLGIALFPAWGANIVIDSFPTQSTENTARWQFSNGSEFPGAQGSFAITDAHRPNALAADYCGLLKFDFSEGGAYVAAQIKLDLPPAKSPYTGLSIKVYRPDGVRLKIRLADSSGQTFQKEIRSVAERWYKTTTTLDHWEGSWGGANDKVFHGAPTQFALLADKLDLRQGFIRFDDVTLLQGEITSTARLTYSFQKSVPRNQWNFQNRGKDVSVYFPPRTLPGNLEKITLRGNATGSPAQLKATLHAHTHFMIFYKEVEAILENDSFTLTTALPPENGWKFEGGENDGKIHGPLRLGTIDFHGTEDHPLTIEGLDIQLTTSAPSDSVLMQYATANVPESSKEGKIQFTWNAQSISTNPLPGKLLCTIKNWNGDVISETERSVTIPANYDAIQENFFYPQPKELNFLEATFVFSGANILESPVFCTWLGDFPRNQDFSKDMDSPFGMGVYLYRFSINDQEKVAKLAAEAGTKWTREEFNWGMLEPNKGQYNWEFFDHVVASAEKYGIQVYGILGYWAPWTKPYTEEGIQDYLTYVRACATRYKGRIHQWEIWNEPNIFFWQGPKELYAELLIRSYKAIKEIDPDIQVLGLSTSGIDFDFIQKMLKLDTPFDILTVHPYRSVLVEKTFIDDLQRASNMIQNRPVWNTEMGWPTHTEHPVVQQDFIPANTERKQAEYIVRTYLTTIASGANSKNYWYNFHNDGNDPWYFEYNMGITRHDLSPKPAYAVFATMTSILHKYAFQKLETRADGTYIVTFQREGKTIYAVWNPLQTVDLPTDLSYAKVINSMGETLSLQTQLHKGPPLYLIGKE